MGATIRRPLVRALFLFLAVIAAAPASATDPVPPPPTPTKTCATGQYLDQFNECQDWCKKPYVGGGSFYGGELIPARFCMKGGGVTIAGESNADNRPACWHYIGVLKDEYYSAGMKVQAYSVYTNPRETCESAGTKECGKLGCDRVEGGGTLPAGISANGTPSPEYAGNISNYQTATQPYCQKTDGTYGPCPSGQVAGGTVTSGGGTANQFCERFGYSYTGMCEYDAALYKLKGTADPPQQANEQSVKYFPSPKDVNCNWSYNTTTKNYQINSGTCLGYFIPPYDVTAHTAACKNTGNQSYAGPNKEGYNPSSNSPYKACLLSNQYDRQRPKVGATWVDTGAGYNSVPMNYEWYSCEYINSKSSATAQHEYKGTGAMCTTLGSMGGDTATESPPWEYRPAPDDYMCENGKPRSGWDSAKCNGTYVPLGTPEKEAQLFFGGVAEGYVRFRNNTTEVVSGVNAGNQYNLPTGYTYNPTLMHGDPSIGTVGGTPIGGGSAGGGSGLGALTSDTEMPSEHFDPWYTPKYENGPKGGNCSPGWRRACAAARNMSQPMYEAADPLSPE